MRKPIVTHIERSLQKLIEGVRSLWVPESHASLDLDVSKISPNCDVVVVVVGQTLSRDGGRREMLSHGTRNRRSEMDSAAHVVPCEEGHGSEAM